MKKIMVFAVAAMFASSVAMADDMQLRIVANGSASVNAGNSEAVTVTIQGRLHAEGNVGGAATSRGLALWAVNVMDTGATSINLDPDGGDLLLTAPAGMANFDRNLGLTNPPGPGEASYTGYSGTLDGSGDLIQVGGGANTIGNTDPPVYPVGSVDADVALDTYIDLASGTFTTPASGSGTVELTLNGAFGNVLTDFVSAPYPVEAINAFSFENGGVVQINFGGVDCKLSDVDCNGTTEAADIVVIRQVSNFNKSVCVAPPTGANEQRADVDRNGFIEAADIVVVRQVANFNTSTGPCNCVPHDLSVCP